MADTNIRLLTRKIEALDADAQHAVEIAVDSLLDGVVVAPASVDRNEIVVLDEYDCDLPELESAIEKLIDAGHRALEVLVVAGPTVGRPARRA